MNLDALHQLSRPALHRLADALESGRILLPARPATLNSYAVPGQLMALHAALSALHEDGVAPRHIALLLRALATAERQAQREQDRFQLVWTGPEVQGAASRDTRVVVEELLVRAENHLLLTTYSLARDDAARKLLAPLAARMRERPELRVQLFLHIDPDRFKSPGDFRSWFLQHVWPDPARLPEVFYDPRTFQKGGPWSRLHAKCIVADDRWALVTSANLTTAALEANIEAGVLLDHPELARRLLFQFHSLLDAGELLPLRLKS